MRKFIKKSILFILILPIALFLLLVLWGIVMPNFVHDNIIFLRGSDSFLYQRVREVESFGKTDILVLGSSHAYRGVDPRIFEKDSIRLFNLGSSSQTPMQTQQLVDRYFHKLNPNIVIYEVYPDMLCSDGVESALDFIANDKIDKHTLKMCWDINDIRTWLSLVYSWFQQSSILDENEQLPNTILTDTYITGGYVEKEYAEFISPKDSNKIELEINETQIQAFNSLIDFFKSKNVEVILVQSPITYYESNRISNYYDFDTFYLKYGFHYINFNNRGLSYPDNFFYDSNHLNQQGVINYNAELLDYIHYNKLLH